MRSVLLSAFLMAFAVLLVSGAPRLIASDPDVSPPICDRVVQAALYAAPGAGGQVSQADASGKTHAASRNDEALISAHMRAEAQRAPGADANGNVLSAQSYMRSVYQVFALGDGFA